MRSSMHSAGMEKISATNVFNRLSLEICRSWGFTVRLGTELLPMHWIPRHLNVLATRDASRNMVPK